ncbi:hypothetical protein QYG89_08905 [Bacillus sp. B190/17]|uniref:Uncharacterized protein n=1 Tax=Bacillus lumedeiriae TaxID=3058829 RepID=A0ABW8I8J1_9BACI
MGYILPITHYQYSQYQERIVNSAGNRYSLIGSVERISFKKANDGYPDPYTASDHRTGARLSKKKEHEAFQVHLAKISGKGVHINKTV